MSFPRRHPAQHGSGAASSDDVSSSSNAMLYWASKTVPPQRPDETGTAVEAHQVGYAAVIPSVPLPPVNPPSPPSKAYPLQSELSQNHRVLHTHIFKEVIPPPQSGLGSRLMVTEVDQYGVERNRQAEFFFNGIVGHVRSYDGGDQQLVPGHPTRQLLASSLQHSRSTWWRYLVELIVARSPPIVWQCWQHRWNLWGTARIRNGRRHCSDCWNRQRVDSKPRSANWHLCFAIFSCLTGNIMQRSLRSSKLVPQIQMPILSSCSRQSIWPTLPATCQSLRRLSPNMLRIMNWTTSRRSPTRLSASCTLTPEWVGN